MLSVIYKLFTLSYTESVNGDLPKLINAVALERSGRTWPITTVNFIVKELQYCLNVHVCIGLARDGLVITKGTEDSSENYGNEDDNDGWYFKFCLSMLGVNLFKK